jgi:hypothetical protein
VCNHTIALFDMNSVSVVFGNSLGTIFQSRTTFSILFHKNVIRNPGVWLSTAGNNPVVLQSPQNDKIAIGRSGLHSFAMVPTPGSAFNPDSPAATGGDSLGYNELLRALGLSECPG